MSSGAGFSTLRAIYRIAAPRLAQPTRPLYNARAYIPFPRRQPSSALLRRFNSTFTTPESTSSQPQAAPNTKPLTDRTSNPSTTPRPPQPEYQITFTCTPCGTRSTHRLSKQGYHHGSTLIACPSCKNRHVMSDHLNIFGDKSMTIEDLMRDRGMEVKKGTLGEDGDLEFWEDGSVSKHVREEGKEESGDKKGDLD